MDFKGINYDVGTTTITGRLTREIFDLNIVRREIEIIKNELHCNAIRISGLDTERICEAAKIALHMGLTVWFSPFLPYENQENTYNYIIQNSVAAEKLRAEYSNLVFVTGCELSLFTCGFVKGDSWSKRLENMFGPVSLLKNTLGIKRNYNRRLNQFLMRTVGEIRKRFKGPVTYASGTWEKPEWKLFDITGTDLYRSSFNKSSYLKELQKYKNQDRPLSIMEFGCCSYRGAEDKGAMGWAIVEWKKERPELTADYTRDEDVQSKYLVDLLRIFENEKVFATFVFTFISYNYLHDEDPRYDLDMASFGIVKAIKNDQPGYHQSLPWLPKKAFFELGKFYGGY